MYNIKHLTLKQSPAIRLKNVVQTDTWNRFRYVFLKDLLNFEFVFEVLAENRFQWILLKKLYKQIKSFFFKFYIYFRNFGPKTENFGWKPKKKNSDEWILIKLQCVTYQWICLHELYKQMESFFQISNLLSIFGQKQIFFKRIARRKYWSNRNVLYINGFISTSSTN